MKKIDCYWLKPLKDAKDAAQFGRGEIVPKYFSLCYLT